MKGGRVHSIILGILLVVMAVFLMIFFRTCMGIASQVTSESGFPSIFAPSETGSHAVQGPSQIEEQNTAVGPEQPSSESSSTENTDSHALPPVVIDSTQGASSGSTALVPPVPSLSAPVVYTMEEWNTLSTKPESVDAGAVDTEPVDTKPLGKKPPIPVFLSSSIVVQSESKIGSEPKVEPEYSGVKPPAPVFSPLSNVVPSTHQDDSSVSSM